MLAGDDARFRTMAASLHLAGQREAARQLLSGWSLWKLYNTSAMDFHLFFCARNLVQLQVLQLDQHVTGGCMHALLIGGTARMGCAGRGRPSRARSAADGLGTRRGLAPLPAHLPGGHPCQALPWHNACVEAVKGMHAPEHRPRRLLGCMCLQHCRQWLGRFPKGRAESCTVC